jgi:hypothetical protein
MKKVGFKQSALEEPIGFVADEVHGPCGISVTSAAKPNSEPDMLSLTLGKTITG